MAAVAAAAADAVEANWKHKVTTGRGDLIASHWKLTDVIINPWVCLGYCMALKEYFVYSISCINSVSPSNLIYDDPRSMLLQVMACSVILPTHYMNQCWLITILCDLPEDNRTEPNHNNAFKTNATSSRRQWTKQFNSYINVWKEISCIIHLVYTHYSDYHSVSNHMQLDCLFS